MRKKVQPPFVGFKNHFYLRSRRDYHRSPKPLLLKAAKGVSISIRQLTSAQPGMLLLGAVSLEKLNPQQIDLAYYGNLTRLTLNSLNRESLTRTFGNPETDTTVCFNYSKFSVHRQIFFSYIKLL